MAYTEVKETLLDYFIEAKKILRQDGKLPILGFPIADKEVIDPIPIKFKNDEEKLKTFFVLGAFCRERRALGMILGLIGCNRPLPKEDSDKNYFFKNLITERATLYPKSLRNEYLILQYIDFIDLENNLTLLSKFNKKANKFRFSKPVITQQSKSSIVEITSNGWTEMDKEINNR